MKAVSGKRMCQLLEANGWCLKRIHGSHHIYGKPGRVENISVPVHGQVALKPGLQNHIMKLAGIVDVNLT